jgi:predicted RNA-binding protein with PUA-like domain
MADYYLLKTEPSEYSFADLERDKTTVWDGVTSPAGVKNLREMKAGAELIIYETAGRKSAVGRAKVLSVDASDPQKPVVKIRAGRPLLRMTSLAEIKASKLFVGSPLIREGRLSVVPLTAAQYKALAAS